jgi:hypothetical protein
LGHSLIWPSTLALASLPSGNIAREDTRFPCCSSRTVGSPLPSCGQRNLIACLTAQMIGPNPRLEALVAICREKLFDEKKIVELNEFKKHARGVAEERNRLVHDS